MSAEIKELFEGTWKLDRHENYQNYLDAAGKYIFLLHYAQYLTFFYDLRFFANLAGSSNNFNGNDQNRILGTN